MAVCLAAIISPVTASADSSGNGLYLSVIADVQSASAGDTISYKYVISSTCNTTINALALTDNRLGIIGLTSASLAPGENISVTRTYTVVSTDYPGPIVDNVAVTGVSESGENFTAGANSSVTLKPLASSIIVTMDADRETASENQTVKYTYKIFNAGQVALSRIVLTDSRLGPISLASDSLGAHSKIVATGNYTVTAADFPGPLVSSATVMAIDSAGQSISSVSRPVSLVLTTAALHLTKAQILKLRGVPGKGIDHAPGLQKFFSVRSNGRDRDGNRNDDNENK